MTLPSVPRIEDVCEKAARLPCSPVLLPRLSRALASEGTTADELEAIIVVDPALASATLRLANSAFFKAGTEGEAAAPPAELPRTAPPAASRFMPYFS